MLTLQRSSCSLCNKMRTKYGNQGILCLFHNPHYSDEWKRKNGVVEPRKEKRHVDSDK